jgi:glutathione S-transferase
MKLYTYPLAPNPRRLHIFLAEKGIELPVEQVDLKSGEQLGAAFRAANPLCTVPALVTDQGVTLTQVIAMCELLEELHPEPPLLGRGAIEKALVREWCHRVLLEGMVPIMEVLRNGSPAFAHRALPGPVDVEQIPALAARGTGLLATFWRTLDAHLAGRDFMVGSSVTMADIDALVTCDFARWIRQSIPEDCAHIRRWHAALGARAAFKAPVR